MGKSIRDYERDGTLSRIIDTCRKYSYYSPVGDLKWYPTNEQQLPYNGQMVLACKNNNYTSWVDVVYYCDGMCFNPEWNWAKEYNEYDAWMPIPMPINFRKDDE